jgi:hypothetical protein
MKLRVKGMIAILNEQLMFLFHFSVAARISINDRSIKSPIMTALQLWGIPVLAMNLTPEETTLEEITLDEIMVVNIHIPVSYIYLYLNIFYDQIIFFIVLRICLKI